MKVAADRGASQRSMSELRHINIAHCHLYQFCMNVFTNNDAMIIAGNKKRVSSPPPPTVGAPLGSALCWGPFLRQEIFIFIQFWKPQRGHAALVCVCALRIKKWSPCFYLNTTHTQSIEGSAPGSRITIEAIVANNVEFNYDMKLNAVAGVLFFNLLDGHFGKKCQSLPRIVETH